MNDYYMIYDHQTIGEAGTSQAKPRRAEQNQTRHKNDFTINSDQS